MGEAERGFEVGTSITPTSCRVRGRTERGDLPLRKGRTDGSQNLFCEGRKYDRKYFGRIGLTGAMGAAPPYRDLRSNKPAPQA